jgi:hypothetical protein
VATLLLITGTLNIIYGIGALDDANIFKNDQRYVLTNLNTLGWVLIVLGIIQLTGGLSLLAGNTYGRVIAIIGGSLGAIGALLSIGGAYPRGGRRRRHGDPEGRRGCQHGAQNSGMRMMSAGRHVVDELVVGRATT